MNGAVGRIEASLAAVAAHEADVHAFAWLDGDRARGLAAAADAAPDRPALFGVPLGVKDIFDTAGIPTEYASPIFRGRVPTTTGPVVGALEAAGAISLGKTVTTEFAFFEPGPTRNPWDLTRTPGGSSSGSAAAVAAGFVDLAVGSQTQGSVIRPAAFCGVVGFKPTHDVLSTDGVLHVAPTLDTVGLFARDVASIARAFAVLTGASPAPAVNRPPRLGVARTQDLDEADPASRDRFERDLAAIVAAGAQLIERPFPPDHERVRDLVWTIQNAEAAHTVGPMIDGHDDLVSDRVRRLVADGRAIPPATYVAAIRRRESLHEQWRDWAADLDAVLTIPAAGEAPRATDGTGDPRYCFRWTLLGAPAVTIPTGLGPNGLPLGLQVVGLPGADHEILAASAWLEQRLPGIGRPDMERRPRKTAGAAP
jgi:amidase